MNTPRHAPLAVVVGLLLATLAPAPPAHAAAPRDPPAVAAPRAKTTTFDFRNIPVRSALQLIAEEGDFNLVVSDSVQGTITLRLVDVTWDQALDVVLQLKGLRKHVDGADSLTVTGG